jgi:uncharacterized membrane protein YfcA
LLTVLAMLAVGGGAAVQGSIGFGMAMVAAPALLLLDPRLVPGPLLCAVFCVTVLMTRREWRDVRPRAIGWVVAGGVPGSALGAWATVGLGPNLLGGGLGLLVVCGVVMSALGHRLRPSRPALLGTGVVSGVMGTVLSMGGPPLALLYQNQPGGELRGTLAGYFTIATVVALTALVLVGNMGWVELRLAVPLIPAALLGYVVSGWVAPRLNKDATRRAVLVLAGVAGIAVMARHWG